MLNEVKIRCFLCVVDTLNFTKASQKLYMSPQAVSKHMLELERILGFQLFIRSKKTIDLTDAGRQCAQIFSDFIHIYDAFVAKYRSMTVQKLPYKIGCSANDFGVDVMNALSSVRKIIPSFDATVECYYDQATLLRLLKSRKLDALLIVSAFLPEDLNLPQIVLKSFPVSLLVSSMNPKAVDHASYRDFSDAPLLIDILENESSADAIERINKAARRHGLSPQKIIDVPNRSSLFSAVEMGQGVALSGTAVHIGLLRGSIRQYPTGTTENFVCVWNNEESDVSEQMEHFAKCLRREYEKSEHHDS